VGYNTHTLTKKIRELKRGKGPNGLPLARPRLAHELAALHPRDVDGYKPVLSTVRTLTKLDVLPLHEVLVLGVAVQTRMVYERLLVPALNEPVTGLVVEPFNHSGEAFHISLLYLYLAAILFILVFRYGEV
jgi:hypothetical protein